jgi:polyphenol oxidase
MYNEPYSSASLNSLLHLNTFNSLGKKDNILAGFTTKNGGVSKGDFSTFNLGLHVNDDIYAVCSNRKLLGDYVGIPTENWVGCEQIHKASVAKVTKARGGKGSLNYQDSLQGTDAIYTTETNILLTLCFADCVPLYFYEPNSKIIGIAHAGWKGSVNDIAGEMIRAWVKYEGVNPQNIYASIGPSIGSCCYIVDDRVINCIKELNINNDQIYLEVSNGQYRLNLKSLNKKLMISAGIPKDHITTSSYCTSCDEELFFSHRRDKGNTGRMLSFIGRKEV